MTQEDKIKLLRKEVQQAAIELEEASKLLKPNYKGMASIYDAAACRAKEVYETTR